MPKLSKNRILPKAITNLRLCSALHGCSPIEVADAFDMSNSKNIFVYDDSYLGYTDWIDAVPSITSKCFRVNNPKGNVIVLLPLDGRIITGATFVKGGVCDGMLLTDSEMCLLEFKTDVTSVKYLTILQRANEAVKQLWHTFDGVIRPRCAAMSIEIEQFVSVEFYVVFDENMEITGVNSALMDLQNKFLEETRNPLFFGHEKVFG